MSSPVSSVSKPMNSSIRLFFFFLFQIVWVVGKKLGTGIEAFLVLCESFGTALDSKVGG